MSYAESAGDRNTSSQPGKTICKQGTARPARRDASFVTWRDRSPIEFARVAADLSVSPWCGELTIWDAELVIMCTICVMKELLAGVCLFGGTRDLETRMILITGSLV